MIILRHVPKWRKWQTRGTQNPVVAISCGFNPRFRHQIKKNVNFYLNILFFCDFYSFISSSAGSYSATTTESYKSYSICWQHLPHPLLQPGHVFALCLLAHPLHSAHGDIISFSPSLLVLSSILFTVCYFVWHFFAWLIIYMLFYNIHDFLITIEPI